MKLLLVSDVLYIQGLSLRSLPFSQRVQELHKQVIEKLKETKEKDLQKIQQASYESIRMRDFWPLKELKKIVNHFIPSLAHEADGVVLLDPTSPYSYGDQPSKMWKFEGDVNSLSFYSVFLTNKSIDYNNFVPFSES